MSITSHSSQLVSICNRSRSCEPVNHADSVAPRGIDESSAKPKIRTYGTKSETLDVDYYRRTVPAARNSHARLQLASKQILTLSRRQISYGVA